MKVQTPKTKTTTSDAVAAPSQPEASHYQPKIASPTRLSIPLLLPGVPGPLPAAPPAVPTAALLGVPAAAVLLPLPPPPPPPKRPIALLNGEDVPDPGAPAAVAGARARRAAAGLSTMLIGRPKRGVESRAERAPAPVPVPVELLEADERLTSPDVDKDLGRDGLDASNGAGLGAEGPSELLALPSAKVDELMPWRIISWCRDSSAHRTPTYAIPATISPLRRKARRACHGSA